MVHGARLEVELLEKAGKHFWRISILHLNHKRWISTSINEIECKNTTQQSNYGRRGRYSIMHLGGKCKSAKATVTRGCCRRNERTNRHRERKSPLAELRDVQRLHSGSEQQQSGKLFWTATHSELAMAENNISTRKSAPTNERLQGTCFKGCQRERELFTIYSWAHPKSILQVTSHQTGQFSWYD